MERLGDFFGTDGKRGSIAGNIDFHGHRRTSRNQFGNCGIVEPSVHLAIQHGGGCGGTEPETINRFQRYRPVQRCLVEIDAEQLLDLVLESHTAHRLAGLGATELQDMSSGRVVAIVVIESDNAMNLGARQIERAGNHRHRILRNVAKLGLNRMQDRQQRALKRLHLIDDFEGTRADIRARKMQIHVQTSRTGKKLSPLHLMPRDRPH